MKKVISIILLISILFTMFAGVNVKSSAVTKLTQAKAVEWIKARKAEKWAENYDGKAGKQCVDLIVYYIYELSGKRLGGSAYQYIGRTDLPGGWIYTSNPEPGDIAVWAAYRDNWAGSSGHVALVESVGSGNFNYVDVNGTTGKAGSGTRSITSPNTYIHPDFKCKTHTWNKGKVTTKATCTSNGVKTYTCTVCGETKTEVIKGGHKYKTVGTIKATLLTDGLVGKKCTVCNKAVKTTVYRPKTLKINKLKVTYNGKYQKPGVTVKDTKGNVISSKYYKLSYKNNKYVGNASVTIKFKGLYNGAKKLAFMIAPKGTSLKSAKGASTSSIKVYWNKQTKQTSGYQIQYSTNAKFAKNNKSFTAKTNVAGKTVKKLKAGTKYYFRIRTYKKVNGFPFYSGWSKAISAKTTTPTTWVKPMYGGNILINRVFAEKVNGSYYWIETEKKSSSLSYYFCISKDGKKFTKKKLGTLTGTNLYEWVISSCLTDGRGNIYYVKEQLNNGTGSIYSFSSSGKNKKVFSTKGLSDITGIYGGYIYYLKRSYNSAGISNVNFCKYNIKTKKSYVIKKKAKNLSTNSDTYGRYMLFEGQRNANGFIAQSVPITLYDAKTNKFYTISKRGIQSVLSGGRVYYTDLQTIYTSKYNSQEMTCIISNSLNGKDQKCEAKLSTAYMPMSGHIGRNGVCFATDGGYTYYAYIFKTKKFVKVNTDGKYIIDIQ